MAARRVIETHVRARTEHFKRGMKEASGSLGSFLAKTSAGVLKIAAFGAALAAAAGTGLLLLARREAQAIDKTAKLADVLGLSTEALVGFEHAANINGASVEELHKGLQKYARSIGEAKTGTGEAVDAFRRLGLDASELSEIPLDEALARFAERFALLETSADRAAVASDVFGRGGLALIPTLSLGRKGLEEMRAEAERLGLTFSRLEAAQVEAANDAITRIGASITGIGRTLAIHLAPLVERVAEATAKWIASGSGIRGKIVDAIDAVSSAILSLLSFGDRVGVMWLELKAGAVAYGIDASKALLDIQRVGRGMIMGAPVDLLGAGATEELIARLEASEENLHRAVNDANKARLLREEKLRAFFDSLRASRTATSTPGGVSDDGDGSPEGVTREITELEKAGTSAGQRIAQAFDVMSARARSFGDVIRSLVDDLGQMVLQAAFLKPLGDFLGAKLGGIFKPEAAAEKSPGGSVQLAGVVAIPAAVVQSGIASSGGLQRTVNSIGQTRTTLAQHRSR